MIGRTVTIEKGAFEKDHYVGRRATIVAVIRCFVVINIDGIGLRACIVDCVQIVLTASDFGAIV